MTTYVIVPVADVTQQMVDVVLQTSVSTLRKSIDKTLAVLKYQGDKPVLLNPYKDYTHAEILVEMAKPEWNPPLPR